MSLLNNKKLSIQITDTEINILIGNKNKIYKTHTISLNSGICRDGNIKNKEIIIRVLKDYLDLNARDIKEVSFVLRGSDLITRYTEVPILKGDALRDAVNFEFEQFIPDMNRYYTNFEIVQKINTKEKKAYKILLVAATKEKIDPIVEIAESINKELDSIDILSNTLARVLRISNHIVTEESTCVFYFGGDSSTISIIEDDILKFERNLPFGVKNIFNEVYKDDSVDNINTNNFIDSFNNNTELMGSFQNLLSSVNNTIRYYNSEKSNKPVTNFIIIYEDMVMKNMQDNFEKYLELPCVLINDPIDLGLKFKFNNNFSRYIAAYGLFLRENRDKLLNLNPSAIDKAKKKNDIDKVLVLAPIITLLATISILIPFLVMNKITSENILALEENINKYSEIAEKNKALKAENESMQYFVDRINGIKENTTKTSQILSQLNSYVPKEISFVNLSLLNDKEINIVGESDTYDAISEFLANLEMSNEFCNAKISYINPIEKSIEVSSLSTLSKKTSLEKDSIIKLASGKYDINLTSSYIENEMIDINTDDDKKNDSTNINNNEKDEESSLNYVDSLPNINKTIIKYSFSISIEGINKDGSKTRETE